MNWFQYMLLKRKTKKIYKQLVKHYSWADTIVKLEFFKQYSAITQGQYSPSLNRIAVSINNIDNVLADRVWLSQVGGSRSNNETITKLLLHEMKHHQQWLAGENDEKLRRSSLSSDDYFKLPNEKDANKFAKKEWEGLWKYIIK